MEILKVTPAIEQRAEVALFSLNGGFVAAGSAVLRNGRVELTDLEPASGHMVLTLQPDAARKLADRMKTSVDGISRARARGDHATAASLAERALSETAPYAERWGIAVAGVPAPVWFNQQRAAAMTASMASLRAGVRALVAFEVLRGAPFWWTATADTLGAIDVATELAALDATIADPSWDAAMIAISQLVSRTESIHGLPAPQPNANDLAIVRVLHLALPGSPLSPTALKAPSPQRSGVSTLRADLERRARAAGVRPGKMYAALTKWRRDQLKETMEWAIPIFGSMLIIGALVVVGWQHRPPPSPLPPASATAVAPQPTTPPPPRRIEVDEAALVPFLATRAAEMRRCLRRRRGAVTVELDVAADGRVVRSEVSGDVVRTTAQRTCVQGVLAAIQFPPSDAARRHGRTTIDLAATLQQNRPPLTRERNRRRAHGEASSER